MTVAARNRGKCLPVSIFVLALDEADRIGRRKAVTVETAQAAGARVFFNEWPGFGEQNRYGEQQCRNEWLLNVDADEVVTEPLRIAIADQF